MPPAVTNQNEQIDLVLHQTTGLDDGTAVEMPSDESENETTPEPVFMEHSSEAVGETTVDSTPINLHKISLPNSIPDVSQAASTIAPAPGIELPPVMTKTTPTLSPNQHRPDIPFLTSVKIQSSTYSAINDYDREIKQLAKAMPARDFKRLYESLIQRDLTKYRKFRSLWKPPRGLEDAFQPWKSKLEDLLIQRKSVLEQLFVCTKERLINKFKFTSIYYDDPGRDISVEEEKQ